MLRQMTEYSDWANATLLNAARPLDDERLDRSMEIGPGSLRRALLHILSGESVWLKRWVAGRAGQPAEIPWPSESERASVEQIAARIQSVRIERGSFLATLSPRDLDREQVYRDSRGSLFRSSLGEMIVQSIVHSIHHRAQAVNILRRLGEGTVELDYMVWKRRSV